jgi:hypothetical protein
MEKNYIPQNLEEAIQYFDKIVGDEDKFEFLKSGGNGYHLNVGMCIRNDWELWWGSPLAKWFYEREIYHADDMSGIILDSFYNYLLKRPIDIEGQIVRYHKHWEKFMGKDHIKIMREDTVKRLANKKKLD